jgi:hypothetical protein
MDNFYYDHLLIRYSGSNIVHKSYTPLIQRYVLQTISYYLNRYFEILNNLK